MVMAYIVTTYCCLYGPGRHSGADDLCFLPAGQVSKWDEFKPGRLLLICRRQLEEQRDNEVLALRVLVHEVSLKRELCSIDTRL